VHGKRRDPIRFDELPHLGVREELLHQLDVERVPGLAGDDVSAQRVLEEREVAQQVGFALLMLLMVFAFYNDFKRIGLF